MLTEGPSVSDIIGDISEYDQDLIAAYDVIAADLPELETTQELSTIEDIEVQNQALIDPDRFLVLSNYGLDPLQPMTSILEDAFVPVKFNIWETFRNKLKKHSVTKNCFDPLKVR